MKDFRHLEGAEYLRIPWQRKWYLIVTALAVLAGVSIFAWFRPNYYQSVTRIIVEPTTLLDETQSTQQSASRTQERVDTIRAMIESRTVLERIVEEFRLKTLNSSIPMEDALTTLRTNLEVSESKNLSNVITMAYSGTDPQVSQSIMRRIAEILFQMNQTGEDQRVLDKDEFLQGELVKAQKAMADADAQILQFKEQHPGELPEQAMTNMTALSNLNSQLAAMDNSLDHAHDSQKAIEFRLTEQKRLQEMAKDLPGPVTPSQAPDTRTKVDPNAALQAQLATKRSQLADLSARYKPTHADVIRLTTEVRALENQLAQQTAAAQAADNTNPQLTPLGAPPAKTDAEAAKTQGNPRLQLNFEGEIAQAQFELGALQDSIARIEKERQTLLKSISFYQKRLDDAPIMEQALAGLMRDRDSKRLSVDNLSQRWFSAQMAANVVGARKSETYHILDEASLPEKPMTPTRFQIFLIGIGAALLSGLGAAFARESFESSITNEEEASALLRIPILVTIPEIPPSPQALLKGAE
jgi:uncharacterized protein involved in exopolysaccharide biosynthesis